MSEGIATPRTLVGRRAPAFSLDASGDQHTNIYQFRGKWLILFFYPRDFADVCPGDILCFDRRLPAFEALNAEVIGVSTDSAYVHDAWVRTPPAEGGLGEIHFALGADVTHEVSKAYGVYHEQLGLAMHSLFIIDPEGIVQYELIHSGSAGRNVDEVLRVLKAIQDGERCAMPVLHSEPRLHAA